LLAATIGIVPWRVVAQNNPQQEELARLKEENSKLREELNQTRTQIADLDRQKLIAAQTQLEARAEQLQEQLQELLVKYKNVHPMVQKTQAQLEVIQEQLAKIAEENKRLGRLSNQKSLLLPSGGSRQLMVTNLHGTNLNFIRRTERELLLAELKLAEEQHAITIKRFEIGKSVPDEVLRAQREVFDIRRELARFDQNRNVLRNLLEEQMKLAQTWLETTRKCIEIGTLPAGSDIIFQKELLKIQRELLGQK
jgi:hypothetical protein